MLAAPAADAIDDTDAIHGTLPSPEATRVMPALHLGWFCHTVDGCESALAEAGFGYGLDLTDRIDAGARLIVTRPYGIRDGRVSDNFGAGADLAMRWHLLAGRPSIDPFAEITAGLVVHADEWPPGGSYYVFRRSWSLGLALHPTPALDVWLGVRQQHLSNGQGLVPHNPAFDGLGGFAGLALWPGEVTRPFAGRMVVEPMPAPAPVVQAQLSLVELDTDLGAAARVEARAPVGHGLWVQVRADTGRLVGVDYVGGELDLAWQGRLGVVGLTGGVQSFGGLLGRRVAAQAAWYGDPLATLVGQLAYATHDFGDDDLELRVQWLLHPWSWFMLGVGFEHTWDERPAHLDAVQPAVSVEIAPPWIGERGFTIVGERQVDDLRVLSLRYTAGGARDLRTRDRSAGLQVLR